MLAQRGPVARRPEHPQGARTVQLIIATRTIMLVVTACADASLLAQTRAGASTRFAFRAKLSVRNNERTPRNVRPAGCGTSEQARSRACTFSKPLLHYQTYVYVLLTVCACSQRKLRPVAASIIERYRSWGHPSASCEPSVTAATGSVTATECAMSSVSASVMASSSATGYSAPGPGPSCFPLPILWRLARTQMRWMVQ